MSLFEMLSNERDKVQRLRDALSDLLAISPSLPKPDTGAEHIWNQRVAAAEASEAVGNLETETLGHYLLPGVARVIQTDFPLR